MSSTSSQLELRTYEAGDAAQLADLYFRSARVLGARRYSLEQVSAWAPAPADPAIVHGRASDGRTTVVAVDCQGAVLGYGDLEADGHIDHLYCRPEAAGTGVAAAILGELKVRAQEQGVSRLYVEASELARSLFERHGFTVQHRRDFEVRGVAIHNYAMECRLSAPA